MATINIITPRYGTISVLDNSLSHYRVQYVPPPGSTEVEFHGFKVFCHACRQYLYTTGPDDNPATFDIQELLNTGHPGDFDISADTSAEVEFLVTTVSADPTMGTTTPVERWIPAQVDHYATYSIAATAKPGYKFVKWVSSTGNEYTEASKSFSVKVTYDDPGYRHYTAYFTLQDYNYHVGPAYRVSADAVSGRNPSNFKHDEKDIVGERRRERLYYAGVLTDAQGNVVYRGTNAFAYVHGVPYKYTQGQQVTVSLEITDQTLWDFLGLRLVGWTISKYPSNTMGTVYVDDSGNRSVSFTADYVGDGRSSPVWYYVYAVICTSDYHKLEFDCAPSNAAKLYITGNGIGESGIGKRVAMVPYGDAVKLEVTALLGVYAALGLIHGWSVQLTNSQSPTAGAIASKSFVMPNADARIVVYICSHRLVCTDDGANLECKPPELLYDCSVPPGTTVYS